MRWIIRLALAAVLTGCAARKVHVDTPAPDRADYIDLEPGWRLRVVTPVLRSGGYQVRATAQTVSGNEIALSTGAEFLGYELAYYAVRSRSRGGVSVEFLSAQIVKEGKTYEQAQPLARLFELPRGARYVRLIFLTRVSRADHDMGVIAAQDAEARDALTRKVLADPAGRCQIERQTWCDWIPRGIAVSAEREVTVEGVGQWVPVR
jgi:hypothetical protein